MELYEKISSDQTSATTVKLGGLMLAKTDITVKPTFRTLIQKYFTASIDKFSSNEEGLNKINTFADKQTNGVIKKLLEPSDIQATTKLIMASACYFKSNWKNKFDPKLTEPFTFNFIDGTNVTMAKGMNLKQVELKFGRLRETGAYVMELPYTSSNFSMYFGLPKTNSLGKHAKGY